MPDKVYNLIYRSDNADILAKTAQVMAALQALDAVATSVSAKLKNYASGSGRSTSAAAKAAQNLANQINGVTAAANSATGALNGMGSAAGGANANLKSINVSVGSVTQSLAGLMIARQALSVVLDASKEIEDRWKKMAEEASDFRDRLRELANIRGETGPNDKVYADVLKLALEVGTTPEKAQELAQSYENIGPTVRAKGHYKPKVGTPEQLEQSILAEAGRTARRFGLDAGAGGEAIGTAGMFHGFETTEDAMDQLGMALSGLSQGKLHYTKGVVALNKAAAKLVDVQDAASEGAKAGRVQSYGEAGIYLGALSLGTGTADQASHRMVQISRALNPTDEDQQKSLKEAGITDQMDDPEKLIQLSKFFKQQKIADPMNWLADHKIGSVATREAIVSGTKVSDVLEARLKAARKGAKNRDFGKQVIKENAQARSTEKNELNADVRATRETMDKVEGQQVEMFAKANELAEERMRLFKPDEYHSLTRWITNAIFSPLTYLEMGVSGGALSQEADPEHGSLAVLAKEGKRVGIDVKKQFPGLHSGTYATRAKAFEQASKAIMAKDPNADPLGRRGVAAEARKRVDQIGAGDAGAGAAPGGGGGPGPVTSTGGERIQQEQLSELRKISAAVGAGSPPGALAMDGFGPAPVPGGARRIGDV